MDTINASYVWRPIGWICLIGQHISVNSNMPESPRFRLVGGTSRYNGRVEVALGGGKWGTTCDDYFGTNEAKVLCKSLGLPYNTALAVSSAVYGQGSGPIWLDDIQCNGYESSIAHCNCNSSGYNDCTHIEDVGVVCTKDAHRYRLVNGSSSRNGHVQIYTGSGWVAVSHDSFNSQAALVLCKSLNLPYHAVEVQSYNYSGATWLENMNCNGNEHSLYDCRETAGTNHNWQRGPMAAVTCVGGCIVPPKPVHGNIRMTGTNTSDVTAYSCSNGYTIKGPSFTVCSSNGYWTPSAPRCIPKGDVKFCSEDVDERGTAWDATVSGTSVTIPCSSVNQDLVGNVSRYCTADGSWLFPEYDCLRAEFKQLEQTIQAVLANVSAPVIDETLSSLSSVTQVTDSHDGLYSGEISKVADMLDIIANVSSEITISEEQSQSFVQTVGNLLDTKNQGAWHSMTQSSDRPSQHNKKMENASKVLKAVGKYADAIVKTLAETNQTERVVPNKNMVLLVATIDKPEDIQFPSPSVIRKSNISTHSSSFHLDKESVKGATSYSCVLYKNLGHILPSTTVKMSNSTSTVTRNINSAVLAVRLHSNLTHHLPLPIVLQFNHLEARYRDASCVFWNEQGLGWDNSGCRRHSSNLTTTVCECDHLTNFAILMSPWREESVSTVAIDVLSYVGCSISVVCLLITVVLHLIHWRYLRPRFRTVVLIHLSVALVFSYTLFIFGADKTGHRDICTAMASLLHYIYLVVFSIMLVGCIYVAWIVLLPLKQSSRPKWTLAAAWALPAVIVGVSLGVTKLRGYGTDSYCWLSTDNGLIWAFIGPALLVILCNLIVLILVIKVLCQTKAMKEKDALARVRSSLWCLLILLPLTGCTWIIGIFYINEDTEWIQYLFVICNTLQGCVIFVCHCPFNKQMVEAIRQRRKRSRSSTFDSESTSKVLNQCYQSTSKSSRFHIPFRFKLSRKAHTVNKASSTGTRL